MTVYRKSMHLFSILNIMFCNIIYLTYKCAVTTSIDIEYFDEILYFAILSKKIFLKTFNLNVIHLASEWR